MNSLLEQFIKEEASPYVRKLLFVAIDEHKMTPNEVSRHFEFNRFEVTLDYSESMVLIEDVLDAKASGEVSLPMSEFLLLLT